MYQLADLDPLRPPPLIRDSDPAGWEGNRKRIEAVWHEYAGELPAPVPVHWEVVAETRVEPTVSEQHGLTRLDIRYASPGAGTAEVEWVPAHLLVPDLARRQPAPGVLALHPTHARGKEAVTVDGVAPGRTYGLALARRGHVVLAPDGVTSGARLAAGEAYWDTAPFYRANPAWTVIGRMMVDHRQGVDLLRSLDVVDEDRIAAVGHSLGGYSAVFLAGLDPRVSATVSSCGSSMWAGDPTPGRWYRGQPFIHLPRLGADHDAGVAAFEWHEITALVAPRPLFVFATTNDHCFPHHEPIAAGLNEVGRLYTALGHQERFSFLLGNGPHAFPKHVREAAYAFLEDALGCN